MSKTYAWNNPSKLDYQINEHNQARRAEKSGARACKAKAKNAALASMLRRPCSGCDTYAACRQVENTFLCGDCLTATNRS